MQLHFWLSKLVAYLQKWQLLSCFFSPFTVTCFFQFIRNSDLYIYEFDKLIVNSLSLSSFHVFTSRVLSIAYGVGMPEPFTCWIQEQTVK